jgi:hypothetical protein
MSGDQTAFEGAERDFESFDRVEVLQRSARDQVSAADLPLIREFQDFFRSLGARHFRADELLFLGASHHGTGSCAGKNRLPPRELWPNIVPLVHALDAIRDHVGKPIRLTNVYRDGPYNTCVGGVSSSQHLLFKAADIVASGANSTECARCARAVRTGGVFTGGIGHYTGFVHVDVRGEIADWKGAGV